MSNKLPLGTVLIQEAPKILVGKKNHLLDRAKLTISQEIRKGGLKPNLFEKELGPLPLAKDFVESKDFDDCFTLSDGWTLYGDDPSVQKTDVSELSGIVDHRSLFDENRTLYKRVDGKVVIERSQLQKLRESLKEDFEDDKLVNSQVNYYDGLGVDQKKWVDEAKSIVAALNPEDREKLTRKNSGINQDNMAKQVNNRLHTGKSDETIRYVLNKTSGLWQ